jgi:hypothetical protein
MNNTLFWGVTPCSVADNYMRDKLYGVTSKNIVISAIQSPWEPQVSQADMCGTQRNDFI